ncbi:MULTISPECIES: hypothetical protein [unclassified Herbaspirillum]|uniref:hypothetical protein n=1 Tax=unclassified Herbaspirillum TaxID=2624150 RepID=UPI00114EFA3C|nr:MULTISPECIES: hypothetical protein [unclassified Herbaspirillum]MBB5391546.1 hypothetical protein [Herbaspirillum sp. SJZ102]TQK12771.1 hypothetical protein FB599_0177 [Herbaspirillum sp. SJZ130]TQK14775.1 hypothetical protein FB598_0115 [Herbaspirillum sp. SJZ106]
MRTPSPPRLHRLSPRHLFLRTGHRRYYRCALAALLFFIACAGLLPLAQAVVPYRSPDDYGPSPQAQQHRGDCRRQVRQALDGKIESEDFVARAGREYFRYVVRQNLREVMFICDARTGEIRRQIDIWGDL